MLLAAKIKAFTFYVWQGVSFCEHEILKALKEYPLGQDSILVLPFNHHKAVDLGMEINGEGSYFTRLSNFSSTMQGSIFGGVKTYIGDAHYLSVAVCNKGRLVDIVDRTGNVLGDSYGTSKKIKVFSSKLGRIGLLVDTDCIIKKNWQLTAPSSDVLLCINRGNSESVKEEIRLFSTEHSIPYLYVDEEGIEWV